jgi:hypothetical protein
MKMGVTRSSETIVPIWVPFCVTDACIVNIPQHGSHSSLIWLLRFSDNHDDALPATVITKTRIVLMIL